MCTDGRLQQLLTQKQTVLLFDLKLNRLFKRQNRFIFVSLIMRNSRKLSETYTTLNVLASPDYQ